MSDSEKSDDPTATTYEPVTLTSEESSLKAHMIINLNANMLVMSQMVGEMAAAVKQVATKITDVEERRRRDRIVFGFCMLIVVMVAGFIYSQVDSNSQQLTILKNVTSPEAQAAQAQNTQKVVRQIDCNDKINDQELLHSVRDVVPSISIPEVPADCEAIIAEMSPTTTTTER